MADPNSRTTNLYERQSPAQESLRRLFRHRSAQVGMVILLFLIIIAIFAPVIAPYDPTKILKEAKRRDTPCVHILGCDAAKPEHHYGY